ncbi:hypothetical protein FACS1894126_2350 [Alphaproteobacteria bacterium]|nr:hypothetical protein FACS1894126_2350 [Alphaproteobacteria bacterium]
MSCIVQKFGGTSVATLDRIKNIVHIVSKTKEKYKNIVVVVSAMAGVTNKFVQYASGMNAYEGNPEYDSVVSSGELVTAGLMAMALGNVGLNARSYASWQVPILTDSNFGHAVIQNVDPSNLLADMENGIIPVVCGFQGISTNKRVTTLGRGGSDLTAVAIASAVNAEMCEIYSDVDGVYTTDPNLYAEAKRLDNIGYYEMLEMSAHGAKVMQEQSVAYALKKNVKIKVVSSFSESDGTIISEKSSGKKFCGLAVIPTLSQIKISCKNKEDFPKIIGLLEMVAPRAFTHPDSVLTLQPHRAYLSTGSKAVNGSNVTPGMIPGPTYSCRNNLNVEVDPRIRFRRAVNGSNVTLVTLVMLVLVDKKKVPAVLNILKQCDFVVRVKQEIMPKPVSKVTVVSANNSEDIAKGLVRELERHKLETVRYFVNTYGTNLIIPSDKLVETVALLHRYCELDK